MRKAAAPDAPAASTVTPHAFQPLLLVTKPQIGLAGKYRCQEIDNIHGLRLQAAGICTRGLDGACHQGAQRK